MMKPIPVEMLTLMDLCGEHDLNACAVVDDFNCAVMVLLLDEDGNRIGDAVCHDGTYGYELGLLEIMGKGCPDKDVRDWLTAEEVIEIWRQ